MTTKTMITEKLLNRRLIILQLEEIEVTDLRNLRDFIVSFFSRENGDKPNMVGRLSTITAVIDEEIIKRGGIMNKVAILHLKYLGRDSWDRPVHMDDAGILWKDAAPRADTSYFEVMLNRRMSNSMYGGGVRGEISSLLLDLF